jgi:hypothetical protein
MELMKSSIQRKRQRPPSSAARTRLEQRKRSNQPPLEVNVNSGSIALPTLAEAVLASFADTTWTSIDLSDPEWSNAIRVCVEDSGMVADLALNQKTKCAELVLTLTDRLWTTRNVKAVASHRRTSADTQNRQLVDTSKPTIN